MVEFAPVARFDWKIRRRQSKQKKSEKKLPVLSAPGPSVVSADVMELPSSPRCGVGIVSGVGEGSGASRSAPAGSRLIQKRVQIEAQKTSPKEVESLEKLTKSDRKE